MKMDVRNNWVVDRIDTVPTTNKDVFRIADGFKMARVPRYKPPRDSLAFVEAGRDDADRDGRCRIGGRGG